MIFCYAIEVNGTLCTGEFSSALLQKNESDSSELVSVVQPVPEWPGLSAALEGFEDIVSEVGKYRLILHNDGEERLSISRADVSWQVPCVNCTVNYYTSSWGREFEPVMKWLSPENPVVEFGTYSGRSTKGCDGWLGLETEEGAQCAALAWSGNWDARVERTSEKTVHARMGITSRGIFPCFECR